MFPRTLILIAGGALLSLVLAPAHAQTTRTSGAVRGTVQGPDGEAVAGATVLLRDVERGATREATTDRDGRFTFGLLLPGTYLYAVRGPSPELEAAGAAGPVHVRVGHRSRVDVRLEPGRYVYAETGEALSRPAAGAGVEERVDRPLLENLPTEGRDWKDLFLLSGLVTLARDGTVSFPGGGPPPVRVDGQEP